VIGLFIKADVSREDEIGQLVQRTVDQFGRLDIAFNNAGTAGRGFEPISNVTADSFDEMFAVNVRAVALGMKHEIAAMLRSGGGAIVNNASAAGLRPLPQLSLYSASKSAVISLTKSAALEVAAQGVRVNTICPATFETEMTAEALRDPETRKTLVAWHPVGRIGQLGELTAAVLYLCSDAAA
jgi:NAD(P)-dependent dehydrogenase (short-subunit alcohol dehydrogenase family)